MGVSNIFITGHPGVGKTTLLTKIAHELHAWHPAGFFTTEIRKKGIRQGFELISLRGEKALLAHIHIESPCRVGKYKVDVNALDAFLDAVSLKPGKMRLVFIDEIGRMECFSEKFRHTVRDLLDSPTLVVATIAMRGGGFIAQVKSRKDVEFLTVTEKNRDELGSEIAQRLTKCLIPTGP